MTKQMIKDKLNRPLRDLRISVIDRCNFRCQYCMPADLFGPDFAFLPKSELLSFEEIERLAHIFVGLRCGENSFNRWRAFITDRTSDSCKKISFY